ncbi:transposase [Streptomyces sp. NPDC048295]|uniref:transposase n=1 Tax=Streptomyces sp. NPDC048295 TaxID=3154617 RepID=UPI0034137622
MRRRNGWPRSPPTGTGGWHTSSRSPRRRSGIRKPIRPFRSDHLLVAGSVSLTDGQRARIEPLLPDRTPKQGGRWRDHREVSDAIAVKFRTGTQWVRLPERYGNWRGVYNRLRMRASGGTWERVFTALTPRRPTV